MPGIRVRNNERPKIKSRRRSPLRLRHPRTLILLIAIRRKQRPHQRRSLVRHLAQRIASKIRTRILRRPALRRSSPPAKINSLDPHPLHRHRLARRIWAKGGDRFALPKKLPQPLIKSRRSLARHRIVGHNRTALFEHLPRGIEPHDSRKSRAVKALLHRADFFFERAHALSPCFSGLKSRFSVIRVPSRSNASM